MVGTHDATQCVWYASGMSWKPLKYVLIPSLDGQVVTRNANLVCYYRCCYRPSDSSQVSLDPETAHPKLLISPGGDRATYTQAWQEVADLPGRFDSTLNAISLQGFSDGRHYWEVDVTGKTYWELGLTYPTIARKGNSEDCWLGRGKESWCVEFFDGEYTAWHGGVPHQLPVTRRFRHIGILCSFPAGMVTFLGADDMTPLFCFCAGSFTHPLHLAVCPGHDHNGANVNPIVICSVT